MTDLRLTRRLIKLFLVSSAVGLLPIYLWPQELLANSSPYFLLVHAIIVAGLVFKRLLLKSDWRLISLINLGLIIWHAAPVTAFYITPIVKSRPAGAGPELTVKVFYANVLTSNDNYSGVLKLINEKDPDVVALLEVNQQWSDKLGLKEKYPYFHEELRDDNFGVAVYSKFKFQSPVQSFFGDGLPGAFIADLEVAQGRGVRFSLLHTFPPISQSALFKNRLLLRRISSQLRYAELPVIVAGDFNATPFSSFYKNFRKWGHLRNAFWGRGLTSTWNARLPFLSFRLDHIFMRGVIRIKEAQVEFDIGSDHLPLSAAFVI